MMRAMLYIHALSPLHAGTGQALDVIDLPVARERSTDLPYVPGSSLKGVLRAEIRESGSGDAGARDREWAIFGPDTENAADFAGSTLFADARLLLFPLRSVTNLFAWVTSPYLVQRFLRERRDAGLDVSSFGDVNRLHRPDRFSAIVASSDLVYQDTNSVFLEDADLAATVDPQFEEFARALAGALGDETLAATLVNHVVLVSDALLGVFARNATEIIARIRLHEEKKTVEKGGLWYEEALPAETLLYAPVLFDRARGSGARALSEAERLAVLRKLVSVQLGGKASVGRGLCRLSWEG